MYCRVGAGEEENQGQFDTPGFPYSTNDEIINDPRGFKILQLSRQNSKHVLQSSMSLLQSWRANSDVKILLYETDPNYPDLTEISTVCDYLVSYTCKGHTTLFEEKNIISSAISRYVIHCYFYL
jgi:hypothetical protein